MLGVTFQFVASIWIFIHFRNEVFAQNSCRGEINIDAITPGIISSPYYGEKPYPPLVYCRYKITAPEGYRIKITFKDVSIRPSMTCTDDKLSIYSKNMEKLLATYCGYEIPKPILSLEGENEMKITFSSGYYAHGKGFMVKYESSPYFTSVCEDGTIECQNRNCYNSAQKCNGIDDCGDGSDEENCGKPIETWPEKCGLQQITPNTIKEGVDRMVGGIEAIPNSWPWQVSLQSKEIHPNYHFCGGVLINPQWVLTAAHCVEDRGTGDIRVHMGAHSKFNKTKYEVIRTNTKIIAYPDLEGENIARHERLHDIALVKLNAPVSFNAGVQPACLPDADMVPIPGWHCYITGWGETRGSGGSDVLKQQDQIIKSNYDCETEDYTQICVDYPKQSACIGDSGGPLNCKIGNKWYVYGVTSYLVPTNMVTGLCVGGKGKALYTSTVVKADWIKSIINKYS